MKERYKVIAVESALRQANRARWFFDICPFNEIPHQRADNDTYAVLRSFHCRDWANLTYQERCLIPQMVAEAFGVELSEEAMQPKLLPWERIKQFFGIKLK